MPDLVYYYRDYASGTGCDSSYISTFTAYATSYCFGDSSGNRESIEFTCNTNGSTATMTTYYNSTSCTLPPNIDQLNDDEVSLLYSQSFIASTCRNLSDSSMTTSISSEMNHKSDSISEIEGSSNDYYAYTIIIDGTPSSIKTQCMVYVDGDDDTTINGSDDDSSQSSVMGAGAIAGIIIGALAVVSVVLLLVYVNNSMTTTTIPASGGDGVTLATTRPSSAAAAPTNSEVSNPISLNL